MLDGHAINAFDVPWLVRDRIVAVPRRNSSVRDFHAQADDHAKAALSAPGFERRQRPMRRNTTTSSTSSASLRVART
jgi:hypothetical protein